MSLSDENRPNVRQPDVYQVIKDRIKMEQLSVLLFLEEIAKYGLYYQRVLLPQEYEKNVEIRDRMHRLNTLQVTVAYPFLLNVYDDVAMGRLTEQELCKTLGSVDV